MERRVVPTGVVSDGGYDWLRDQTLRRLPLSARVSRNQPQCLHRIQGYTNGDTKCYRREKRDLSNLDDNLAPGMTGRQLVEGAERIVKLVHRINDGLDLAYIQEDSD